MKFTELPKDKVLRSTLFLALTHSFCFLLRPKVCKYILHSSWRGRGTSFPKNQRYNHFKWIRGYSDSRPSYNCSEQETKHFLDSIVKGNCTSELFCQTIGESANGVQTINFIKTCLRTGGSSNTSSSIVEIRASVEFEFDYIMLKI